MVSVLAKELAHLAAGHPSNSMFREPRWTTPNRIALELSSMRLREFSAGGDDLATLVCAPLALHDATLTDFAPDHSLVAALQVAGLRNVFVTDWRSASPEMRFFSIDSYLADLNVVVDELGGCANLIGVCQGGWMALAYAARYPSKIHGLVLAGAPVDINAGESELSRVAHSVAPSVFKQLVELGDGCVRGAHLLQLWKHPPLEPKAIHSLLQVPLLWFFLTLSVSPFKSKSRLEAENAALRHQRIVLQRRVRGRVQLTNGDRLFLVLLYRWFPSVLRAITIIRPETLVRWHRAGFRHS